MHVPGSMPFFTLLLCTLSKVWCFHATNIHRYDINIDMYDKTVYRNIWNLLRSGFLRYYSNIIVNRGEHCLRQFQYWRAYNDELRFTVKHQMIMAIFVYTSEWSANYLLAALHRHSNVGRKCFITASPIWGTLFLSFQMGC